MMPWAAAPRTCPQGHPWCQLELSKRAGPNGLRALSGRAKKPGWKNGLEIYYPSPALHGPRANGPALIKNCIFFI
ncbi:hypothetical protein MTR_8g463750 [Medicago truncatula]|uniref:Uncharacterized protein n=1 Tax=Medicago truncatula TaxID=3880 RepID=A0A072TQQ3_MEDTR|nr:hypothetical protein MTR_8g463750 [Medicago truncatula]